MRNIVTIVVALAAATLVGCTSLPSLEGRTVTTAIPATPGSRLYDAIAPLAAAQPGLTGIYALGEGRGAFAARAALAEAAERSLDVQYYIWHDDVSGRLLFETLRRAADRGVRVRLLLDDNNTSGLDATLAALDAHENVEVRLFNPFTTRGFRPLGYVTDFGRLNRRMHNKSFTADGVATIVGGRNVGDEYFAAGEGIGFLDLDVVAIGAVVPAVAKSFDEYWSSPSAYPADRVLPAVAAAELAAVAEATRATLASPEARAYAEAVAATPVVRDMLERRLDFEWARADLVVDDPAKGLGKATREQLMVAGLERVLGPIRRELHVVSPYFVPMKQGVGTFCGLRERGISVAILTNALESTDVAAVHAGYSKRRKALLGCGVDLWELKRSAVAQPVGGPVERSILRSGSGGSGSGTSGGASLHAKTFAVDRDRVFVGSFNFDPRSAQLNTEMGLVIHSPRLATQVAQAFEDAVPASAYRVRLAADGGLEWLERTPAGEVAYAEEPGTTGLQRFGVGAMALLPIDWLL